MADTLAALEKIDVLANVAGYLKPGRIRMKTAVEEIDRHLDINVKG